MVQNYTYLYVRDMYEKILTSKIYSTIFSRRNHNIKKLQDSSNNLNDTVKAYVENLNEIERIEYDDESLREEDSEVNFFTAKTE